MPFICSIRLQRLREVALDEGLEGGVEVESTSLASAEELLLNGNLDLTGSATMLAASERFGPMPPIEKTTTVDASVAAIRSPTSRSVAR